MKKYFVLIILLLPFAQAQLAGGAERAATQIGGALDDFFGAGGTPTVTPEQAASVNTAVFDYQYDPAVSQQIHAQFADGLVQEGVEIDKQAFLNELAAIDLAQQQAIVDQAFPNEGFKANNLIDVLAMSVIANYFIYEDLQETTPESDLAIRDLFKVAFAQTPEAAQLSNTDKQTATEALFLALLFSLAAYEEAVAGTPGSDLAQVKTDAKQNLMMFGLHPGLITIGTKGFEQTAALKAATPQIEAGTITFEQAFPEIFQDFVASQSTATPLMPGVNEALASVTEQTPPATPATPVVPAPSTPTVTTPSTPTNPLAPAPTNPLNPLAVSPDLYSGSYSDGNLTLTLTGNAGAYTGELDFNGQPFPVQATENPNGLTGSFSSGGNEFTFNANLAGNTLTFESDGNSFTLERTAPVNPLGN